MATIGKLFCAYIKLKGLFGTTFKHKITNFFYGDKNFN